MFFFSSFAATDYDVIESIKSQRNRMLCAFRLWNRKESDWISTRVQRMRTSQHSVAHKTPKTCRINKSYCHCDKKSVIVQLIGAKWIQLMWYHPAQKPKRHQIEWMNYDCAKRFVPALTKCQTNEKKKHQQKTEKKARTHSLRQCGFISFDFVADQIVSKM